MNNSEIADLLKLLSQLLELHDENPFKAKSYGAASFRISRMEKELWGLPKEELDKTEGIGKGTAAKLTELFSTGNIAELDSLLANTPPGVLGMFSVKGIGPKKIRTIWKELGAESIGELFYACNENRLVELKGFGQKTQEQIIKSIEFIKNSEGKFHYSAAEKISNEIVKALQEAGCKNVSLTGAMRRKCEIVEVMEILASNTPTQNAAYLQHILENISIAHDGISASTPFGMPVKIYTCAEKEFAQKLFETTGTAEHLKFVETRFIDSPSDVARNNHPASEQEIYISAGLPWIEPELREGLFEEQLLKDKNAIPRLVELSDLKGILHNHTKYSDGIHTLAEMAAYCKELGYEYLGICDHSKSAQYAGGLLPEKVLEQQKEIDALNQKMHPFRIFKGIESDILSDGSLDYDESILRTFDFIVASVHSNLKMDEEKATARILKAVENPYTTILGHPTGRLLLSRPGYPLDHKKIIDACAANGVVIELNAHPYRLDLDWRWIPYALEKGVKISINPDAHNKEGYRDMHYGICVARKGALTKEMTFNALTREEIEKYFLMRKKGFR